MNELTTQIGRIRTILKHPAYPSGKILPRVVANLKVLKKELAQYRDRVKFTSQDNISKGIAMGLGEWFGLPAAKVADLFEVKAIWKDVLDTGSIGTQKGLTIVGDKSDVTLALHLIGYLKISLDLIHDYEAARTKERNKRIRAARRSGDSEEKTYDAREVASNIRSKAVNDICSILDKLLAMRGKSNKEDEILKYIFNNLKPNFADKPGPKTPRHYSEKVDWSKARTNPTKFVNNKLIN